MEKKVVSAKPVLGDKIARLIHEKGFTHKTFLERAPMDPRTLQSALNSKKVQSHILEKLARGLGVAEDDLVADEFRVFPSHSSSETAATPAAKIAGVPIQFSAELPPEALENSALLAEWLNRLADVVHLIGEVQIEISSPSGVRVIGRVADEGKIRAIATAFAAGSLAQFAVNEVAFESTDVGAMGDVSRAIAKTQSGALANPVNVAAEIQRGPGFLDLIRGLFNVSAGPFGPRVLAARPPATFQWGSGRELTVHFDSNKKMISRMTATIPAGELAAAYTQIVSWAQ